MIDKRFGNLVVMSMNGRYCNCRCDCGNEKSIRMDHLKSGATLSCGCVGRRNSALAKQTHGMSSTRVFKIWLGMIDRCKNDHSGNYGQRGITVCKEWTLSFDAFYRDMGEPPTPNHSIDRIDVNGPYSPNNCRWATPIQQARNTRRNTYLNHDGLTLTIAEWAEKTSIQASTICVRLYKLQWPVDKALTTPVARPISSETRESVKQEVARGGKSYREIGRIFGISHHAVRRIADEKL